MGEVSHGSKGNEELNGPTLVVIGVRENDRSGESWSFAEEDSNFSCRLHLALLFWNQTCTGRKGICEGLGVAGVIEEDIRMRTISAAGTRSLIMMIPLTARSVC